MPVSRPVQTAVVEHTGDVELPHDRDALDPMSAGRRIQQAYEAETVFFGRDLSFRIQCSKHLVLISVVYNLIAWCWLASSLSGADQVASPSSLIRSAFS